MFLSLITLFFLVVFSLLYISKSLAKKPQALTDAVGKINDNIDQLGFWGLIYGVVAAVLAPILAGNFIGLLISAFSNLMVVALTLPYGFEKIVSGREEKINAAILEVLREMIGNIARNEKILGYVGAVTAFVLLAVTFR